MGSARRLARAGACRMLVTGALPVLILAALMYSGTAGASTPRTASRTTIRTFHAYSSTGKILIKVTGTRSGHCYTGSLASQQRDAWRCISGNGLYDPCFSSAKRPKIVVCTSGPYTDKGTEIKLTKKLPSSMANSGHLQKQWPWIVKTSGGLTCEIGTGANGSVDGLTDYYYCNKQGGQYKSLWGKIDNRVQPWKVRVGSSTRPSADYTRIAVAWF